MEDENIRKELIKKKDDAIRELADQQILPLVRNIPEPQKDSLMLPANGDGTLPSSGQRMLLGKDE